VFFVPAYVSITGSGSRIGYFFTALAGPLINLVIYAITTIMLKKFSHVKFIQDNAEFINALRIVNLWLGVFNLIPFPGTDGFNALNSLFNL
jgi:Zn-dependent protease